MFDTAVITLRPVSHFELRDVKFSVDMSDSDFNRAVSVAITYAKKVFKKCPIAIARFDVVSIEVI